MLTLFSVSQHVGSFVGGGDTVHVGRHCRPTSHAILLAMTSDVGPPCRPTLSVVILATENVGTHTARHFLSADKKMTTNIVDNGDRQWRVVYVSRA